MTRSNRLNLLAGYCSSKIRHLSLTPSGDRMLPGKSKMQNSYKVFNKFLLVFVFLIIQSGTNIFAQQVEISGKVTSAVDGTPLAFANIVEKGTTNGVSTDANGEFKLNVKLGSTLVVSYIGYAKVELVISEQMSCSLIMVDDVKQFRSLFDDFSEPQKAGLIDIVDAKI